MDRNDEIRAIIRSLEALIEEEPKDTLSDLAEKCADDEWHLRACRVNLAIRKISPGEAFFCISHADCDACMFKLLNNRCPIEDEPVRLEAFMKHVVMIDDERRLQGEG